MKNMFKLPAVLTTLLLASGCATIVSGNKYPVSIQSNPSGAEFTVVNNDSGAVISEGTTPDTVTLYSGASYFKPAHYTITIKKAGHEPKTINLKAELNSWYIGNILFGGPLGLLVVDPISGAMYALPTEVSANLNSLSIVSTDNLTEEQKAKLQPIGQANSK